VSHHYRTTISTVCSFILAFRSLQMFP
jgi:hypothetical protein